MSIDLRNGHGEEFSFSTIDWAFYLNLAAIHYGWRAAGTLPPDGWDGSEGPWQGAYDWNAGQQVTTQDALGFALALERYLADPKRKECAKDLAEGLSQAVGFEVTADDDDVKLIVPFVRFAKTGGFSIW